jgi:ComF family protein
MGHGLRGSAATDPAAPNSDAADDNATEATDPDATARTSTRFGGRPLALFRQVCAGALDLLLPPHCLTCDAPVQAQGTFCAACFREVGFVTEPCCAGCSTPFAYAGEGGHEGLCPACRADPPPWGRARAALLYEGRVRRLVQQFKYGDRTEYASAIAPLMARAGAALLREAEVLVPVPLHRARLFTRRYNQAALLAWALGRLSGVAVVPDALRRVRPTPPLFELGAVARALAVAGAFDMRPGRGVRIAGRRVLLVDDILTSGATCAACTRLLLQAGAASVDVLVAARVPDTRLR